MATAIANEVRRLKTAAENQLYRSLTDAFPEPLNAKDLEGRFVAANPATAELMQAGSAGALIGKTDFDFYPAEVAAAFRRDEEAALGARHPVIVEQHVARRDDSTAWMSTLKAPLVGSSGSIAGLLTHNRDITEIKALRDERERTLARLDDALASMADALAVFDRENRLVLCNEQYRALFPRTAALRVPGAPLRDLLRASLAAGEIVDVAEADREAWIEGILRNRQSNTQHDLALGDGRVVSVRLRPGSEGTSVVVISDVSEERNARWQLAELNRQLADLARTDSLTGLANRRVFDEALASELQRSGRTGEPLSLLMIDIDIFKAFNDSLGHVAGDKCLRDVSGVISRSVNRAGDLVARYGGEEFAVILPIANEEGARLVAEAIRHGVEHLDVRHPAAPHGTVTVSVGIATSHDHSGTLSASDLVEAADRALYLAKSAGRNRTMAGPMRPPAEQASDS